MRIRYKEDPRAWAKSSLFSAGALLLVGSILRWRHILGTRAWSAILVFVVILAIMVWLQPQWFRRYYRFSTWAGFWSSQAVAWVVLVVIFVFAIVPAGIIMRLAGKDPLHLKRSREISTYWKPCRPGGSLDRLF